MDPKDILSRLEELRQLDPEFKVFGSNSHRYKLNDPCETVEIEHFEREYGVVLPDDYRLFLTQCGNGGAGPFYGLFPIRHYDGAGGPLERWTQGDGIIGVLREPFPHGDPWNLGSERLTPPDTFTSDIEEHRWHEEFDTEYWSPRVANGCFPIADQGCAYRSVLVVAGAENGHVWTDGRAGQEGIFPDETCGKPRCTFGEWYESWLLGSLKDLQKQYPL